MKSIRTYMVTPLLMLLMACVSGQAPAQDLNAAMVVVRALGIADTALDTTVNSAAGAVNIRLADGASAVSGAASSASVQIDNRTNSIVIRAAGTYALSGRLSNGNVVVDADANVRLVLNGVNISSSDGAPLALFGKQKKVITLAAGTQNTLTDAALYTRFYKDDEPNGSLFSKNALTINGTGSLTVNGRYNNGISCKDDLRIMSGTITVTAKNNAVKGNDSLVIKGGTITVSSAEDALKSDSEEDGKGYVYIEKATLNLNASEDGIQGYNAVHIVSGAITVNSGDDAIHADKVLVIDGGTITIPKSYEGLEAAKIVINGGTINLTSSDDGINAAADSTDGTGGGMNGGGRTGTRPATGVPPVYGTRPMDGGGNRGRGGFGGMGGGTGNPECFIIITGGTVTVNSGGDGIDSNGSVLMTGGTVIVHGPTRSGDGALDSDGSFTVKGGLLIAAGAAGMVQIPGNASTQYSAAITFRQTKNAGTRVLVQDATGRIIADYTSAKAFQSFIVSAGGLSNGQQYSVTVGSGAASSKSSFTVSGIVTAASI
ncbi:lipoprotein [Spirochaetia bacterium]|nr:lipoprotein [Spirochaetia bacterium]